MGRMNSWLMDMESCVFDAFAEVSGDSTTVIDAESVIFMSLVNAAERDVMLTANTAMDILATEMNRMEDCENFEAILH